jgi:O-antigen ligase
MEWWIAPSLVVLAGLCALLLTSPVLALATLTFVAGGPFDLSDRLSIPLPVLRDAFELREILMTVTIVLALLEPLREDGRVSPRYERVRLSTPTLVFLAWALLSVPLASLQGNSIQHALTEAIPWIMYLPLPLYAVRLVRTERQWKTLLIVFLTTATLSAALAFLQMLVGPGPRLISSRQLKVFHGNVRVYAESQVMMLFGFAMLVAYAVAAESPRRRAVSALASFVIAVGMLVSVSRTIIAAEIAVLVLAAWWAGRGGHTGRTLVLVAVSVVAVSLFAATVGHTPDVSILDTVITWFSKVLGPSGRDFGSVVGRLAQYRGAITQIRRSPILGVGWGGQFLDLTALYFEPGGEGFAYRVHSTYLQLAVKLGIPGLLAFLYWIFEGLRDLLRLLAVANDGARPAAIGLFTGYVAFLFVSTLVSWGGAAATLAQLGIGLALAESYLVLLQDGQPRTVHVGD